jgi:hypothetical protein
MKLASEPRAIPLIVTVRNGHLWTIVLAIPFRPMWFEKFGLN